MMEKPCLFLFDFDETLSVRSSCYPIEELAPDREKLRLDELDMRYDKEHRCWNRRMTEVHKRLAEQDVHTPQLIEAFRQIELSPGTEELFRAINDNHHEIVVLSNACDLLIEECLRAHHLLQYVEKIESNPVRELDPIMIIEEYTDPSLNQCQICDPNLCKGSVIDKYRDRNLYRTLIFVGDGDNDVCPALRLNQTDYVFAKIDPTSKKIYEMYNLLKTRYVDQLKTELFPWTTMNDVHATLHQKKIL